MDGDKSPVSTSSWERRLLGGAAPFAVLFSLKLQEADSDCYAAMSAGKRPQQRSVRRTPGKPRPPMGFCHVVTGWRTQVAWGGHPPKRLQAAAAPSQARTPRLGRGPRSPKPREQAHLVGEVCHDEGRVGHAGFLEVLAAPVPVVQLLGPVLVRSFGDLRNHKTRGSVKGKRKPRAEAGGWSPPGSGPHDPTWTLRGRGKQGSTADT